MTADRKIQLGPGQTDIEKKMAYFASEAQVEIDQLYKGTHTFLESVGGSSSALTASAVPPLDDYGQAQVFIIIPTVDIGAPPHTLNVDGLGAINLRRADGSYLGDGELRAGVAYQLFLFDTGSEKQFRLLQSREITTDPGVYSGKLNLCEDAGRFSGSPEPQSVHSPSFVAPSYLNAINGAVINQGPKFISNNSTYGGTAGALDPDIDDLISKFRDANRRRYGVEFYTLSIDTGTGTAGHISYGGSDYYYSLITKTMPLQNTITFGYWVRAKTGKILVIEATYTKVYVDGVLTQVEEISPSDGWKYITVIRDIHPSKTVGYNNVPLRLYTTQSISYLFGCFYVHPGKVIPSAGDYDGIVPSLKSWR